MNGWAVIIRRYRTLALGFAALAVFVYGSIVVFGVQASVMLEIAASSLLLVALLAVLGFVAAMIMRWFRK